MQPVKRNRLIILSSILFLIAILTTYTAFATDMSKKEGSKSKMGAHGGSGEVETEGSKSKMGSHGGKSYSRGESGHSRRHGYGHHSRRDPFRHILRFKKELGLDETQLVALKDQKFEYRKTRIRSEADLQIAKMEKKWLLHSENLDEGKVRQLAGEIGKIKAGMITSRTEAELAIRKTLTAEQRKKVNQMFSRHSGD